MYLGPFPYEVEKHAEFRTYQESSYVFLPLKHTVVLFTIECSAERNLTSPWSAGKLQRLLSLIYPVCGNIDLLDLSNIVENFKSSEWIKKFIIFWKTNLKNQLKLTFLDYSNESWQQFHVKEKKEYVKKNFHLKFQCI